MPGWLYMKVSQEMSRMTKTADAHVTVTRKRVEARTKGACVMVLIEVGRFVYTIGVPGYF